MERRLKSAIPRATLLYESLPDSNVQLRQDFRQSDAKRVSEFECGAELGTPVTAFDVQDAHMRESCGFGKPIHGETLLFSN